MDDTALLVIFLSLTVFVILLLLVGAFWFNSWYEKNAAGISPYTGLPMRRLTDLSYYSAEKVLHYLYDYHQYDNRIFKLKKSAFCRETGRIFQDCVTWYNVVKIDRDFLNKRYPGHYVSWGSLSSEQQKAVREMHDSLSGFQTDYSSPTASPALIEPAFAFAKPGPLYVDIETKVLLGWKIVPDTELEVLIVQKPIK